jgi:hypothetical protein
VGKEGRKSDDITDICTIRKHYAKGRQRAPLMFLLQSQGQAVSTGLVEMEVPIMLHALHLVTCSMF